MRKRSTRGKMALALRESALGMHGLQQFVARAPLRNVHQAVFAVLALKSEPGDPRLEPSPPAPAGAPGAKATPARRGRNRVTQGYKH